MKETGDKMARTTNANNLAKEVMKGMEQYKKLTDDALEAAVKKSATQVRNEIKATAPRSSGSGKHHADSWGVKAQKTKIGESSRIVYGRTPRGYALAHLLEYGHVTRNGRRSKAFHYIAPAEQHGIETLEREIEKALKG